MTDCNPVLTPMEVGQRLSSLDCPDTLDKANVKESTGRVPELLGGLGYTGLNINLFNIRITSS
eukprot:1375646-Rhodomonas_salina.1